MFAVYSPAKISEDFLILYTKLKCIKNLNVRAEIKILKEKHRQNTL